jgi:hypothetical protein
MRHRQKKLKTAALPALWCHENYSLLAFARSRVPIRTSPVESTLQP